MAWAAGLGLLRRSVLLSISRGTAIGSSHSCVHWNDVVLGVQDTGDLRGQRLECLPLLGGVLVAIIGALHAGDDVP